MGAFRLSRIGHQVTYPPLRCFELAVREGEWKRLDEETAKLYSEAKELYSESQGVFAGNAEFHHTDELGTMSVPFIVLL